jgi:acetylornithine deacetylase/succinyl-diaminopimelate desuccinylase-like protein
MIFESDEESGSADIHLYIEKLRDRIGRKYNF